MGRCCWRCASRSRRTASGRPPTAVPVLRGGVAVFPCRHAHRDLARGRVVKRPSRAEICLVDGCDGSRLARGLCNKHYTRMLKTGTTKGRDKGPIPVRERFIKALVVGNSCWTLRFPVNPRWGYAQICDNGRTRRAHRVAYELFVGPIPRGLVLDHLCRNRACVNPLHLEPVTQDENVLRGFSPAAINARKTHCIHGHEFTPENTKLVARGRCCRECDRERKRVKR